jgi:hypothetical protein
MAVDPYVPTRPEDAPRRSVAVPPARGWKATRPGDLGPEQPKGSLMGTPGPDAGYALTLAHHFRDRLQVARPETVHDAEAVAAEVAIKRAALFGRAPVMTDLELVFALFGWLGGAPPDLVEWRRLAAAGAAHDYNKRRALVDRVGEDVLRRQGQGVQAALGNWRELLHPEAEPAPVR